MRIGFMGGTFSPPHKGHLHAAKFFLEEMKLDRLLIIPAKVSPFKAGNLPTASDKDRFEMTGLCFKKLSEYGYNVEISDIELSKDSVSYTVETIYQLKKLYPGDRLYMFVGSDMFISLEKWKNSSELFSNCKIYTRCRENGEVSQMIQTKQKYE